MIPDSVTNISNYAFYHCTGLTSITIPGSVTSIGESAFYDCTGLTKINWNAENVSDFTSNSGIFYNAGTDERGIDIVFGDNVKRIPAYIFYISDTNKRPKITSVTIGNSITSIGNSAFKDCTGLTKINWNAENVSDFSPNSEIFYNAGTAGNGIDVVFGNNVKSIPGYAFYISDTNKSPKIKSVAIGNSVTRINVSAFMGCIGLTSITIPNNVTSIGNYAFKSCTGLTKINWNAENVSDFTDTSKVFYDAGTAGSRIDVVFGNSVKSIPAYAFDGCTDLTSVTIGNSVISVGNRAFFSCTGLTKINWNAENVNNFISNSEVFYNAGTDGNGIDVVFGDNVKRIPEYAFYVFDSSSTPKIKSVTIGNSVTSIGNYAFNDCTSLISVTIPDSVTSIGDSAFYNCRGLTNITIPNSVTSIGNSVFEDCTGLASVTIGNSVIDIGNRTFYGCIGLTSVTIGNSVTSIGVGAFYSCRGLTSITIPNSVTSIGGSAFGDCTSLTSVTIPNSVTSISDYAFSSCIGLTSVTIGNSVTSIGSGAFYSCRGLTSITIPNSVTSIGGSAFSSCTGLTEIDFSTHTTVPTLEAINAFNSTPANLVIKVPSTLLNEWKAATNWSTYADKIMGV